jgi:tetratricopeptide (TPR) repeat protein
VIPLGMALRQSVAVQARVIDQLPVEVLDCSATLRELKRPGDRLIARKWHVAFHADVEGLPFPFADSLPDLARYAHENHVRWLYFSWPEAETRPKFYHLLDTSGVVPGLIPRKVTAPHPSWLSNDTLKAFHMVKARLMVEGDKPEVLLAYARLSAMRGDREQARGAALRAVRYAPQNPDVLTMAAGIALMVGDGGSALNLLQRARTLSPRDANIQVALGLAHLSTGGDGEAAAAWRPVIEACGDPEVLLDMVRLFHAQGDREAEQRAMARLRQVGGMR